MKGGRGGGGSVSEGEREFIIKHEVVQGQYLSNHLGWAVFGWTFYRAGIQFCMLLLPPSEECLCIYTVN